MKSLLCFGRGTAARPIESPLKSLKSPLHRPWNSLCTHYDGSSAFWRFMHRILIVDDVPLGRDAIARLLRQEGYRTTVARNGAEALVKLKEQTPDLILLDNMMPEVDGLTFLSGIRRFPKWRKLPVMMFTGNRDKTAQRQAEALKVTDYIVKADLTPQEILQRINSYFAATPLPPPAAIHDQPV
jgi:CheY-like chemotaxis protein